MSYIKQNWRTGDTITAEKLNHMEGGIESASSSGGGSGEMFFTEEFKASLLNIFEQVAYISENGQDYYDALEAAMNTTPVPTPKVLTSISAVFTQGANIIYDSDTLDSLKQYLVVTVHYDDGSSATTTNYTLSGTLVTGTSTITVDYEDKTTTFTVTVTHATTTYDIINTLVGCTSSNSATLVADGASYSATITANNGYILAGATVSITMGGTDITSTAYDNGTINIASVSGALVISVSAVAISTYTVTNALTGCASSNNATTAFEESSYSATITASTGYTLMGATVSVVMGETDITSTAYDNGTISIASVSGNITITIVAELNITPGVWYDLTPSMYTATRSDVTINSGGFIHQENVVTTSPETKYPEIMLDSRITGLDFDIDNTGAYTWLIMAGTKDNYGAIALTQSSGGYPAQMITGQTGKTTGLGGTKLNGCPYGNGHYTITRDSSGITISKTGGDSVTYTTANQPIYDYGDSSSWILGFCIQPSSPTGNGYKNIKVMFGSEVTE